MSKRVRFLKDWGKSKAGQTKRVANSVADVLLKEGAAHLADDPKHAKADEEKKAAADVEASKKAQAEREAKMSEPPKAESKKARKAREKAERKAAKAKADAEG
jgi:hypothetical protein